MGKFLEGFLEGFSGRTNKARERRTLNDLVLELERKRSAQNLDIQTQQLLATPSRPLGRQELLSAIVADVQRTGALQQPGPTTAERVPKIDPITGISEEPINGQSPIDTRTTGDIGEFQKRLAEAIGRQPGGVGRVRPITEQPSELSVAPPPVVLPPKDRAEFLRGAGVLPEAVRKALTPKEKAQRAVSGGTATPGQREVALGREPVGVRLTTANLLNIVKFATPESKKKFQASINSGNPRGNPFLLEPQSKSSSDPTKRYTDLLSSMSRDVAREIKLRFGGSSFEFDANTGSLIIGKKGDPRAAQEFRNLLDTRMASIIDLSPGLEKFRIFHLNAEEKAQAIQQQELQKRQKLEAIPSAIEQANQLIQEDRIEPQVPTPELEADLLSKLSEEQPPKLNKGEIFRDEETGRRFVSDGIRWNEIK